MFLAGEHHVLEPAGSGEWEDYMRKTASTAVPVHPLLAERWSPRGFDRNHQVSEHQITALLEAARWAPSAGNSQPWRFLVTRRGEYAHSQLFATLAPGNQAWANAASALVLVAARTASGTTPQPWALYDTGQAVASLVTQAQAQGLAVHQIGGFDSDAVRAEFALDPELTPVVVLAVGRADPEAELPSHLAARETAPRTRHQVSDLLLASTAPGYLSAA
jgi:nitroreductase